LEINVFFEDSEIDKLNAYVEYKEKQRAREDGHELGMKLGLEKGIEQGTELTIRKTIQKMLQENLDIGLISRITGKTEEEINKIKQINLD